MVLGIRFWRVSFDSSGTVMECRKVDAPGNQMLPLERGESCTVRMVSGGRLAPRLWVSGLALCGWRPWVGTTRGIRRTFGPHAAVSTDHFSFHRPEGDRVAAGENGSGRVQVGHCRWRTATSSTCGSPTAGRVAGASGTPARSCRRILASSPGKRDHPLEGRGSAFDYFSADPSPDRSGRRRSLGTPEGGRVFNAGGIDPMGTGSPSSRRS